MPPLSPQFIGRFMIESQNKPVTFKCIVTPDSSSLPCSHLKPFHSPVSSTEPGTSESNLIYTKKPTVKFSCKGEVLKGVSDSVVYMLFYSLSEAHSQLYKHLHTSRPESPNKSLCSLMLPPVIKACFKLCRFSLANEVIIALLNESLMLLG